MKQAVQGTHAPFQGGSSTSNLIEPSQTISYRKIARCGEFFHMSLEWFDCTEHPLTALLQGRGVQGAYCAGWLCTCSGIEPHQTFSLHNPEIARSLKLCHKSSRWFNLINSELLNTNNVQTMSMRFDVLELVSGMALLWLTLNHR